MLCFTMEEAWLERHPDANSVHLRQFPDIPAQWRDDALAAKWRKVRTVRRVVTGALEVVRRLDKEDPDHIGSSLEASPVVHVTDPKLIEPLNGIDMAEVCITSDFTLNTGPAPQGAYKIDEVAHVAVVNRKAQGRKCARSWRVLPEVGSDPDYPDLSLRDAAAMREIEG